MRKIKHNKKRNTAFLYEALIREMTKSVISKDEVKKNIIVGILKEFFAPNTTLSKELHLYKTILESKNLDITTAEKLLYQVRHAYTQLDEQEVYNSQSDLIRTINKRLSSSVYNNFVPNYKSIATLSQLFGQEQNAYNVKSGVILEQKIINGLICESKTEDDKNLKPIDNLVFKTFVSKFNETYSDSLLSEQRELLNKYILSFVDNAVDIKIFLNEEIGRLHSNLISALEMDEIRLDQHMLESTRLVIEKVETLRTKPVDKELVEEVLKIQNLVNEIKSQ
tara:strand:+ start:175 stop:1014 length:840 start_codon:yes stop_codon:yes gene_type:complete